MIRVFLFLALFFYAVPAPAKDSAPEIREEAREKLFNAESFTLDNGLQIVVVPNSRVPAVTHMVWYKTGAADEPHGKSGIAHFLEHLMFKGSGDLGPGEFSKTVRALGGNDNAFTGQDYTAYYQSIAKEYLETVMAMEAGRMRGLALPPAEVESERKVILEERRQRIDNDPRGRFGENMNASLFVNHPYGTPVIGWFHEMEGLSREDAKNFYDRWYGPNNAILIVSGDVTGAEVKALAEKIYGKLERVEVPERNRTRSPPLNGKTRIVFKDPQIREPSFQRIYRVPSYRQSKKDALALQVLEDIMGGGPTSRLYKALVVEQKIATGAGLAYDSSAWDDSRLTVYAVPAPGTAPETVEAAIDTELRRLVSDGVTDTELQESVTRMRDEAAYALDSLSGPAMLIGNALATGASLEDAEYWPYDIAEVTAEEVQDAARRFLDPDGTLEFEPVTGYLLPPQEDAP